MPRSWKADLLSGLDGPARLGRGDVKLLLLAALEDSPKHGYDLLKAFEALLGGRSVPSAGVIYPSLKTFSEQGLLKLEPGGERRRYSLTAQGKKHLGTKREALALALKRLKPSADPARADVKLLSQETQKLVREMFAAPEAFKPAQIAALRKVVAEMNGRVRKILE